MCIHYEKKDTDIICEPDYSFTSDQNKYICTSTVKIEMWNKLWRLLIYILFFSFYLVVVSYLIARMKRLRAELTIFSVTLKSFDQIADWVF